MEIIRSRLDLLNESHFDGKASIRSTNHFLGTNGLQVLVQIPCKYTYDESGYY